MSSLGEKLKKKFLVVISAPAGTGKTTLVKMLIDEFPDKMTQSISCTTRAPREREVDGKDYHFLSKKAFQAHIDRSEFLEYAIVFGNHYGTLKKNVLEDRRKKHHVILVIDTQGALSLKGKIEALFIFVAPPSTETLNERLIKRKSESAEMLQKRLNLAHHEIEQIKHYDYLIINDDLDHAYLVLKSIILAEEHRINHLVL